MLKRLIHPVRLRPEVCPDREWLNVDGLVQVEISSETADHSIESALLPGRTAGWRAAEPGEQTIRLIFNHPQRLRRIWLNFIERVAERTQEYVLRWSPDGGKVYHDIVRQQWNFSPQGSSTEAEDHRVDLRAVTVLELTIVPDTSGGEARASLAQLRLA
jgi:hypothetical protein